jgi:hypothetical protein
VRDPYQQEGNKGCITEEIFDLVQVDCLGLHCRRLLGKIGEDGFSFAIGEKGDVFGIWNW